MFENLEIFRMAQSLASHASTRQAVVARNIAHADTPGYKQRDIDTFAESFASIGDGSMRRSRAGHLAPFVGETAARATIVQNAAGTPDGNTVSLEDEILKSAQIRQQHDMALSIYRSGLTVLRASLGRR